MAHHPDVTLAILAGGQGRRLGGVVKGLLEHEGRPLIAHLLDLRDRFADAFVVADGETPWIPFCARGKAPNFRLDRRDDALVWVCAERPVFLEPMPGVYASRMGPPVEAALRG